MYNSIISSLSSISSGKGGRNLNQDDNVYQECTEWEIQDDSLECEKKVLTLLLIWYGLISTAFNFYF
jgi:hypothetical protein